MKYKKNRPAIITSFVSGAFALIMFAIAQASSPVSVQFLDDDMLEKITGSQESGGGGGGNKQKYCDQTQACDAAWPATTTVNNCGGVSVTNCPSNRKITRDCNPSANTSEACQSNNGATTPCNGTASSATVCTTRQYNQCYVRNYNGGQICSAKQTATENCGTKCN